MEEIKSSSTYSLGPPWIFKGRGLYQLHLVKAEAARTLVPKELRLVEAFGYTLGGFFLAHYDDSPAGVFDELVVIAGLVWNPPASCAWAGRVLVSSHEACWHGRKDVGLPSHYASFSKRTDVIREVHENKSNNFLKFLGVDNKFGGKKYTEIEIADTVGSSAMPFCNISIPMTEKRVGKSWMGPRIRMYLPSFRDLICMVGFHDSGNTEHNPLLLKYSCHIDCSIRTTEAAKITLPNLLTVDRCNESQTDQEHNSSDRPTLSSNLKNVEDLTDDEKRHRSISVLLSKPILALEFSNMRMQVEAPKVIHELPKMSGSSVGP